MIHVDPDNRIVFFRGPYKARALRLAVLEATGWARWYKQDEWLIVGLADEDSRGLSTGMPFSPPDSERQPVGYRQP